MDLEYCPWCVAPLAGQGPCPECGRDPAAYAAPAHHLAPGTVLRGRYLVGRALGEGGFGITYVGRDLTLDRRVAVKEYFPFGLAARLSGAGGVGLATAGAGADYEAGRERFLQEARTLARVDDRDAVVGVGDFFEEGGTAYIVMEYVAGSNLGELCERRGGRIGFAEALALLAPVMRALGEVHATGLVHRDVSPENVMFDGRRARLIDFGCARDFRAGAAGGAMTVVLRYDYAAPEQYTTRGQGPWTDVYGMCATLYRCVCGAPPARAADRFQGGRLVPPSELGADVPPAAERALLAGLELDASLRPQTMGELLAGLEAGPDDQWAAPGPDDARTVAPGPTRPDAPAGDGRRGAPAAGAPRSRLPLVVAACVTVALVAVALVLVLRPQQATTGEGEATVSAESVEAVRDGKVSSAEGTGSTLHVDPSTLEEEKPADEKVDEEQEQDGGKKEQEVAEHKVTPEAIERARAVSARLGAGFHVAYAVQADGTVVSTKMDAGDEGDHGQCDVSSWSGIMAVAGGYLHVVGLKADGTALAAGDNDYGQCNVSATAQDPWVNLVAVDAGDQHTVGLRADGSVVACGRNQMGQCDVSGWSGITQIAAGGAHTVGLKADGTCVAVGANDFGELEVGSWTDIVAIAAGEGHTVGLHADGTVVSTAVAGGDLSLGQDKVDSWTDCICVSAGYNHTVGLRADGTVLSTGAEGKQVNDLNDVSGWSDIAGVRAGNNVTYVAQSNGAVLSSGIGNHNKRQISGWQIPIGTTY